MQAAACRLACRGEKAAFRTSRVSSMFRRFVSDAMGRHACLRPSCARRSAKTRESGGDDGILAGADVSSLGRCFLLLIGLAQRQGNPVTASEVCHISMN